MVLFNIRVNFISLLTDFSYVPVTANKSQRNFQYHPFLKMKLNNVVPDASEISAHRITEAGPSAIITFRYHIPG